MHSIQYSNQASVDIDDAISHIASESVANAINYLSRYEEKIELLKLNPYMGVECKHKLIKRDCRVLVHESHIMIHKVLEEEKTILLVRVFHSAENYQKKVKNGVEI